MWCWYGLCCCCGAMGVWRLAEVAVRARLTGRASFGGAQAGGRCGAVCIVVRG